MRRIETVEDIKVLGKKIQEQHGLDYLTFKVEGGLEIHVLKEGKKIYEFLCPPELQSEFFLEAVRF